MFDAKTIQMLLEGIAESLYMTIVPTVIGYLVGMPLGVLLTVTDRDGIRPNAAVYKVIDFISNIFRSIPFLILVILLIPLSKLIVGKSYGCDAMIVSLTIAAAPYIARMVESSLKEVDHGVIEAAQSMGASTWTIVTKVLLTEARTSLIVNATIVTATILGYSAMAGAVGAGGLGAIAVRYGYNRYQPDIMIVTVVILVLLVQIMQAIGMRLSRKFDRRRARSRCATDITVISRTS